MAGKNQHVVPKEDGWAIRGAGSKDHGPHHFHAGVADEWEVRIFFLQEPVTYEMKYEVKKMSNRILRVLLEGAA